MSAHTCVSMSRLIHCMDARRAMKYEIRTSSKVSSRGLGMMPHPILSTICLHLILAFSLAVCMHASHCCFNNIFEAREALWIQAMMLQPILANYLAASNTCVQIAISYGSWSKYNTKEAKNATIQIWRTLFTSR